ncbi:MAG: hypothetical protein QXE81_04430 [Desulfurococcaceae archaeon]
MLGVENILIDILICIGIILSMIIAGYLVGKLVNYLFVFSFRKIGIDDWFMKFSMGKAIRRTGQYPGEFFGNISSWLVFIAFTLIGFYLGFQYVEFSEGATLSRDLLTIYLYGLVKALIVIIIGFMLVDSFVSYVYRSSELRAELRFITPVAEYLRILFYIVVIIFALELGGIDVSMLTTLVTPIVWGLALAVIAIIVIQLISDILITYKTKRTSES